MKKLSSAFLFCGTIFLQCFSFTLMAQPGSFQPPLLDCGPQDEAQIICNTRAPEDFEVTPDSKYLMVAKFGLGDDGWLELFDIESQEFSEIDISTKPLAGWGDKACEAPVKEMSAHGIALSKRESGEWQFYVVNHNERESMEMYELLPDGNSWRLEWHGCHFADQPYNDVSLFDDGSFIATRPTSMLKEDEDLFGGQATGDVVHWSSATGEYALPKTEIGYPNGNLVSNDGQFVFISGWTSRDFHKYDLTTKQLVKTVALGFMPDNLTWTPAGKMLAAGIKGVFGNCPDESEDPCLQGFKVVEIDPETLAMKTLFDSAGKALINGTSVAIEVDGDIYVGSFQGTRMVKFSR